MVSVPGLRKGKSHLSHRCRNPRQIRANQMQRFVYEGEDITIM